MAKNKDYWFPAKTYGWGWGLPTAWQGWLAYGLAAAFIAGGAFIFSPVGRPLAFQIYTWTVALLLVAVCWIKGEPPSWRWGK